MKTRPMVQAAAVVAALGLALTGCTDSASDDESHTARSEGAGSGAEGTASAGDDMAGMDHGSGGEPPAGIEDAADPRFPVGTPVTLSADHMVGMDGASATVSGAFDTTAYAVDYTPTDGGDPVTDHKWVVQEELEDPGQPPLGEGTDIVIDADHVPGMKGAEGSVASATDETVYMVDIEMDGMTMTDHMWVVESEMRPAD